MGTNGDDRHSSPLLHRDHGPDGLCPSCGAKRAAIFSELLHNQVLADVPHAQWVLSIPKMLRPYFLYHREPLGDLARLAYETVREMMAAAIDEPDARPGMVGVIQTFGSSLKWNPHIHAIVTRGVFLRSGSWATHPLRRFPQGRARLPPQGAAPSPRPGAPHPRAHRPAPILAPFRLQRS